MHLLYVIDSLVPGGAERSLAAMAPGYARRGVTLDVAYLHNRPGLQSELTAAGASLHCLAGPGGRIGWVRRARQLAVRLQPDLVHTTLADADLVGRIAANLVRVPVVSSLVNVQYGQEHVSDPNVLAWRMRILQATNALTARRVTRFHAVTDDIAQVMSQRLRIPRHRIDVIPRGRDPKVLGTRTAERRSQARTSMGIGLQTQLIFAAARQEHQKRLDLLLEALPLVKDELGNVRLVIAGRKGSATPLLENMVHRLGLNASVEFLGPRSDVPGLLCGADVLVLPSRREGLPGILLEAMALETPIVASDLPGVREAVGEGVARRVASNDPKELAVAIIQTLTDVSTTDAQTRRGRDRFLDHFTIDAVVDRMIAFYERALDESGLDGRTPDPNHVRRSKSTRL